eukprot:TRINITY_DN4689_c0_g1_i1.p1 TRINITY_DN4689_c0_g1~~TRINITY_DN4689_c0_g1_i1.p1  ORF type:complete len:138 (-),score=9.49 TRINITY_DN4689_c0_g1_i1:63-476(-)
MEAEVIARKELMRLKEKTGLTVSKDPVDIPETLEEAEIFMGSSIKTDAEVAAQTGASMTLHWNEFNDTTFRRCVEDLTVCGMAVVKRDNEPQYGITTSYVDPLDFVITTQTDPNSLTSYMLVNVKKILHTGATRDCW